MTVSPVAATTGTVSGTSGSWVVDEVVDVVVVEMLLDLPTPNDATATSFSSANCLDSMGVGSLLKITPADEHKKKLADAVNSSEIHWFVKWTYLLLKFQLKQHLLQATNKSPNKGTFSIST